MARHYYGKKILDFLNVYKHEKVPFFYKFLFHFLFHHGLKFELEKNCIPRFVLEKRIKSIDFFEFMDYLIGYGS